MAESEHQSKSKETKKETTGPGSSPIEDLAPSPGQAHLAARQARVDRSRLTPRDVMILQRTVGNLAVQRLLANLRSESAGATPQVRSPADVPERAPSARPKIRRVEENSGRIQRDLDNRQSLIEKAGAPKDDRVSFGRVKQNSRAYKLILDKLDRYHYVVNYGSLKDPKKDPQSRNDLMQVLDELGELCRVYLRGITHGRKRYIRALARNVALERRGAERLFANFSEYKAAGSLYTALSAAVAHVRNEDRAIARGEDPKAPKDNSFVKMFAKKTSDEPIGWKDAPSEGQDEFPSLDNMRVEATDKFAEGESHISIFETEKMELLVGKIARERAGDNLAKELQVYRDIYKTVGQHPNLGKVYGMAIVPYGDAKVPAMMMEYVPGMRGSETMTALRRAWMAGHITSAQYWGAVQFIGRKLLSVVQHLAKAGIAHNDIKPENYVVNERTGEPILIDLGLHSKHGEQPKGITEDYMAPEQNRVGSEKGDVFTVGSTLLSGVEQMKQTRGATRKPNQGLGMRPGGAFEKDDEGNALPIPGVAGVESSYTKFMGSVMQHDPALRPDSAGAQQSDFLTDTMIDDAEARRVLMLVVGRQLPPVEGKSKNRVVKKAITSRDIDQTSSQMNIRRGDVSRRITSGVTSAFLKELESAGEMVVNAERDGVDSDKLRDMILRGYSTLSSTAKAKPPKKKRGKKGPRTQFRPELEDSEIARLIKLANDSVDAAEKLLQNSHISNLIQLEFMRVRCSTFLDLIPPPIPRPRYFGKVPKTPVPGTAEVRQRLADVGPLIETEIEALTSKQQELVDTSERLLDGDWFETARSALEKFKEVNPKVQSKEDPKITKAIRLAAQKAMTDTEEIREQMERFAPEAFAFLRAVGNEALASRPLSRARNEISKQYDVAAQLLRLEREWLAEPETSPTDFGKVVGRLEHSLGSLLKFDQTKAPPMEYIKSHVGKARSGKSKSLEPSGMSGGVTDAPVSTVSKPTTKIKSGPTKSSLPGVVVQQLRKGVPLSQLVTMGMVSAKKLKVLSESELSDLAQRAEVSVDALREQVLALSD